MQTVTGYAHQNLRRLQQFRLFHHDRPALKAWRRGQYQLDIYDYTVCQMSTSMLVAVDFAGWYLPAPNIMCIESNPIAQCYYPDCRIEPDVAVHRPSYVPRDSLVFFKNPWFLRYATVTQLVEFLKVWATSPLLVVFEPRYIQHNHLKYNLVDIVKQQTKLNIEVPLLNMWRVTV